MILYDYVLSPDCYKVRLLASLVGAPLELRAVDQGVDARTGCGQPGLEQIALVGQRLNLLRQQGVGPLQFFMAQQQVFHTFGDLVDEIVVGHGTRRQRAIRHCSGSVT